MNSYISFTFVLLLLLSIEANYLEDYCWKDYNGTIPSDALVCGRSRDGRLLYMGQILFDGKLIPGKIYHNDNKIYFEFLDVEYSSTQNVKILCTQHPNKFQWLTTRNTDLTGLIPKKQLLKGGFQPNCLTFIGRLLYSDEIKVGKVLCCRDDCHGLYTTDGGKGALHDTFQILSYNNDYDNLLPSLDSRTNILAYPVSGNKNGCKKLRITIIA